MALTSEDGLVPRFALTLPSPSWEARQSYATHWDHYFRLSEFRVGGYRPKISLCLERGNYVVKTVDHEEQLLELLRLRHSVFHEEHHGRRLPLGIDIDDIDFVCDHLVIEEKESGKLVGGYRLTSTLFSKEFYANHRFHLAPFFALPGNKLELGRACVALPHRNGSVLQLLWRGISAYAELTSTEYLFGSASVRTTDPHHVATIFRFLEREGHLSNGLFLKVKEDCRIAGIVRNECSPRGPQSDAVALPPLFQSYLRAGAKIAALPAVDRFLGSADFFTLLKWKELAPLFGRRFTGRRSAASK